MLLEGTRINGEAVIAALSDHLVNGMLPKDAIEKHGLSKSHFYTRLNLIKDSHVYAARVSRFYTVTTRITVAPTSTAPKDDDVGGGKD